MAGYTGEKRWNGDDGGVSALTQGVCVKMIDALTDAEAAYAELQELYGYAGGTVQLLADLLFTDDIAARTTPGTNTAWTIDVVNTTAQIDFGTNGSGEVDSVTIVDGGFGYTDNGAFSITIASDAGWVAGTTASISYTVLNGSINSVTITDAGSGFTASLAATTDVAATDLPATPATGMVSGATISTAGTGYVDGNYSIKLQNTGSAAFTATLNYTVSGGAVTALTVADPGRGYTTLGTGIAVVDSPLAGSVPDTTATADEVAKAQAAFDAITALHELYQAADNVVVAQEDRLAQLRRMT